MYRASGTARRRGTQGLTGLAAIRIAAGLVTGSGAAGFVTVLLLMAGAVGSVQAAEWQVELAITNGAAQTQSLHFGVHPEATSGIDALLGEVGLPPWPPSSLYETRFMLEGCEGLKLDLRDSSWTTRTHQIRWQAGAGGYPVVVRWDRSELPYASLYILDGYGGIFIPRTNLYEADSIVIPSQWSFVNRLTLEVTPGISPGAEPTLSPISGQQVFLGQQFAEVSLDAYVFDPDTPDDALQWFVTENEALVFEVDDQRVMRITAPPGWTGSETVTLTVRDPEHHTDHAQAIFTVATGGLPAWTVGILVTNAGTDGGTAYLGIAPEATGGIDPALDEVALPPWPPSSAFDCRLLLPDGFTWSARDLRASAPDEVVFRLRWQAGEGGYPVTIEWPEELPLGDFAIQDNVGGFFIPPFSMRDSSSLVIPVEWDFIDGVDITVMPTVDMEAPLGPTDFRVAATCPDQWVRLAWTPCDEPHFAYYELFYDTESFDGTAARWVWDWTEDGALNLISTSATTIPLPEPSDYYYYRIRAWDEFGNVGEISPLVEAPTSEATDLGDGSETLTLVPLRLFVEPGLSRGPVRIRWSGRSSAGETATVPTLGIYDLLGRCIRRWDLTAHDLAGEQSLVWDGRTVAGTMSPSGVYFVRLDSPAGKTVGRVMIAR